MVPPGGSLSRDGWRSMDSAALSGRRRSLARSAKKKLEKRRSCAEWWRLARSPSQLQVACVQQFRGLRTRMLFSLEDLGHAGYVAVFLAPCVVDLAWVVIYFVERQNDVQRENGPCVDPELKPTPAFETPRSQPLWVTQVVFSFVTVLVWMPFRILYAGSRKFRIMVNMNVLVDLVTAVPFIVSVFLPSARSIFVPSFLRIWIFRFELGFIESNKTLPGEVTLFCASVFAVGITMIACFEWAENNFPMTNPTLALDLDVYTCVDFLSSLYWLVVTVSTVGYGDVVPQNWLARTVTLVSILIFVILLPYSVNRISGFIKKSHDLRYARYSSHPDESHVVVHGFVDNHILSHALYYFNPVRRARRLKRIADESHQDPRHVDLSFLQPGADASTLDSVARNSARAVLEPAGYVVLMSESELSEELLENIDLGYQRSYISLFEGSLLNPVDLSRCQIKHASAIFILPTIHTYSNGYDEERGSSREVAHDVDIALDSACRDERKLKRIRFHMNKIQRTAEARNRLYSRDYRTLLRAWATHQQMKQGQLLVVVLFHQQNQKYLLDGHLEREHLSGPFRTLHMEEQSEIENRQILTLCVDSFQQEVLAASCLVPGFSTFLTNLFIGEDREVSVPSFEVNRNWEVDQYMQTNIEIVSSNSDGYPDDVDDDIVGDFASGLQVLVHEQEDDDADSVDNGRTIKLFGQCSCFAASSPRRMIELYTSGLQNELEVMVVEKNNPLIGLSRYNLCAHIFHLFSVVTVSIHNQDLSSEKLTSDFALFCQPDEVVKENDRIVFIGHGSNLDKLFDIDAEYFQYIKEESASHHANQTENRNRQREILEDFLQARNEMQEENHDIERGSDPGIVEMVQLNDTDSNTQNEEIASMTNSDGGISKNTSMDPNPGKSQSSSNTQATRTTGPFQYFTDQKSVREFLDETSRHANASGKAGAGQNDGAKKKRISRTRSDTGPNPHVVKRRSLDEAFVSNVSELRTSVASDGSINTDSMELKHCIICSPAKSPIIYFINALRRHHRHSRQRLLWMVNEPPSEFIWDQLAELGGVSWMLGESCVSSDLLRAGIREAGDFVIFSDYFDTFIPNPQSPSEPVDSSDVDRYTIQSHRALKKLIGYYNLRSLHVHTNINAPENGQYLHESLWLRVLQNSRRTRENADFHRKPEQLNSFWRRLWSSRKVKRRQNEASLRALAKVSFSVWPLLLDELYAAGEIWSASSFFFILFSGFIGGKALFVRDMVMKLLDICGRESTDSKIPHGLRLVRIPRHFHGKTYGELFKFCLLRRKSICLGLYVRYGHGLHSAEYTKPVVVVNPRKDTTIHPCDYLYLLGGTPHRATPTAS